MHKARGREEGKQKDLVCELPSETENSNWHTLKKKKKSEKFLKGAEGQTEDVEIFGKLKLLQITYQRYDMTE